MPHMIRSLGGDDWAGRFVIKTWTWELLLLEDPANRCRPEVQPRPAQGVAMRTLPMVGHSV